MGKDPALTNTTEHNTMNFLWRKIVCRYEVPKVFVIDNGLHFDGEKFRIFCKKYGIKNAYATPAHPKSNGQVEAANNVIKHHLKTRLSILKRVASRAFLCTLGISNHLSNRDQRNSFLFCLQCQSSCSNRERDEDI